jgi:transcriptional regulator of acetoin/glycerol metabolism
MLGEITAGLRCDDLVLSADFEKALQSYRWPGNIRELRQTLERVALFSENHILTSQDLHVEYLSDGTSASGDQVLTLSELEHHYIQKVLQIEHGRVEAAAKRLGLSRSALYEKIKKYSIDLSGIPKMTPEFRTNFYSSFS